MASSSSSSASRRGFAMDVIGQSSGSASTSHAAPQSRPIGRPTAFRDEEEDDDEEDEEDGFQRLHNGSSSRGNTERRSRDEMLTGYSKSRGAEKAQRSPPRVSNGPRVIAKQSDLNWMEERKRRLGLGRHKEDLGRLTSMRMPGKGDDIGRIASASGKVENEDVVKDRIGDEKQLSGLQIQKRERGRQEEEELEEIRRLQEAAAAKLEDEGEDVTPSASQTGPSPVMGGNDEDDEAAARAALLSGQGLGGGSAFRSEHEERIIPISEEDALKRDTESRPEAPTMSDYAKMPVEEFGAALLRGMGWKEGTGAGKNRQGPTSAPEVKKRAALLGLGAKERQLHNDSSASDNVRDGSKKNFRVERPERRYIPVIKREREIANGDRQSSTSSPPPPSSHRDRERHREIERDRERPRERERDRDRPRERSRSPADRQERRRREGEEEGYDRRRDDKHHSRSDRAYDEDHDRRKRQRERDRDYDRDRHSRHSGR